jgi:glycyl-tRNA synthetase beta subunit
VDAWFFVVSRQNENELILANVLNALTDALTTTLRSIDKRTMLDNYDSVLLTVDELVDGGMILETDATAISNRVGMKAANTEPAAPAETSSFSFAFTTAKESWARSLMR